MSKKGIIEKDSKRCPGCGIERPFSLFSKDRSRTDGLTTRCKICHAKYHLENRDRILARKAKEWEDPKKRAKKLLAMGKWYRGNIDQRREYNRIYHRWYYQVQKARKSTQA